VRGLELHSVWHGLSARFPIEQSPLPSTALALENLLIPEPAQTTPNHRSVYIYPDVVPPIQVVSYHVATDKRPAQNGDKFRSILSDNLQPIATRGKKARDTLLVDQHCGNGCSIKRAPLSVSY